MKNIGLILLLFFFANVSYGQALSAREIVKRAWQKHTSGKVLTTYKAEMIEEVPGKTPDFIREREPLLELVDSVMNTQPDSVRQQYRREITDRQESAYQEAIKESRGVRRFCTADMVLRKVAWMRESPNPLRGNMRRNRSVETRAADVPLSWINPVEIVQEMINPGAELNDLGIVWSNGVDFHAIQYRLKSDWIDVHISVRENTISRVIVPLVDNDPLIGQGPLYYKHIYEYNSYDQFSGFLLPRHIEEITTIFDHTRNHKVIWSLNQKVDESSFEKETAPGKKVQYVFREISDGLVMMEDTVPDIVNRSAISLNSNGGLDLFTVLSGRQDMEREKLAAIRSRFPDRPLKRIFATDTPPWLSALQPYFDEKVIIHSPKGKGMFSLEAQFPESSEEGKKLAVVTKAESLKQFDRSFVADAVTAIILNPDGKANQESYAVAYYMQNKQAVYVDLMPYDAAGIRSFVHPKESLLLKEIETRGLKVKDILFAGSFVPLAPVSMSFDVFRERVLNAKKSNSLGPKPKY